MKNSDYEETIKILDEIDGETKVITLNEKAIEFLDKNYKPLYELLKDIVKLSN